MLRRTVSRLGLKPNPVLLSVSGIISLAPSLHPLCHASSDSCAVAKNEGLSVALTESEAVIFGSSHSAATTSLREEQGRRQDPQNSQRPIATQPHHRSTIGAAQEGLSFGDGYHASRRTNNTVHPPSSTYSALEAMVSDMTSTASTASSQHIESGTAALSPSSLGNRPWHSHSPMRSDGCSTLSNHAQPAASYPIHDSEVHAAPQAFSSTYSTTIPISATPQPSNSTHPQLPSTFVSASRLVQQKNHSHLRHSSGSQPQANGLKRGPLVAPTHLNQATKHRKSKSTIGNSKENASPDSAQYAVDADRMSNYPSPTQSSSDVISNPSADVKRHLYRQNATYLNPTSTATMMHRVPTCSFDSPHFGSASNHNSLNGSVIGITGMMAASTMAARPNTTMRSMAFSSSFAGSNAANYFSNQRRFYTSDRIVRTPPEQRVVTQEPNGNGGMGYREEFHKAISRRLLEGVRRGAIDPADIADNLHNVPDTRKTVLYPQNKDIPIDPVEEALMSLDGETPAMDRPQMPGATISITPTVGHSYAEKEGASDKTLLTNVLKEEADLALSRQGIRDVYETMPLESPPTADIGPIGEITDDGNTVSVLKPVADYHKMSDDDRFEVNAPSDGANSHSVVKDSESNYHRLRRRSSLQTINRELHKLRKQSSMAASTGSADSKVLPPAVTRDADGYSILNVNDMVPTYTSSPVSKSHATPSSVVPNDSDAGAADRMDRLEELYAKVESPKQQASIILPDAAVDSFAIGGRAQLLKFSDSAMGAKVLTKRRRDRIRQKLGSEAVMGIAVASSGHKGNTEFVVSPASQEVAPATPSIKKVAMRGTRRRNRAAVKTDSEKLAGANNEFLSENDREALSVQSDENYRISNNPTRNEPTLAPTAFGQTLSQVPGLPEGVQMRTSDGRVRISPDKESKWWMNVKRKRWISRGMGGQTRDANRGIRYYKP